jgi:quinol monooxygenase YgiN
MLAAIFSSPAPAAEEKAPTAEEKMLSHAVFFTLKNDSPENRQKLVTGCKKYLADHPGVVWFSAGPLAEELGRDVNDRDFDVALLVVFKNKAAHDTYQDAPKHKQFIAELSGLWEKVRVFDSYIEASSHGDEAPAPSGAEAHSR